MNSYMKTMPLKGIYETGLFDSGCSNIILRLSVARRGLPCYRYRLIFCFAHIYCLPVISEINSPWPWLVNALLFIIVAELVTGIGVAIAQFPRRSRCFICDQPDDVNTVPNAWQQRRGRYIRCAMITLCGAVSINNSKFAYIILY